MTLGGDLIEQHLEHYGKKGMQWGIRNASRGRDLALKAIKDHRAASKKFKIASQMSAGEVAVSAILGGPVGLIGYKVVKRRVAASKMKNRKLSADEQTNAAKKIKLGEALVVTAISSPLGLVTYAAAKAAAAHNTEDF